MLKKLKGLFLNTSVAKCSIYESGKMSYKCLSLSNEFILDYIEINKNKRKIPNKYNFYIFNYHPVTMGWLDLKSIKKINGFKATIVLEVGINDPFTLCPDNIFDAYIVLDPTLKTNKNYVHAFPRPLEKFDSNIITNNYENNIPIIGSFGFFQGDSKGFDKIIEAVNKEFENAIVKINVLNPDWGKDNTGFKKLIDYLNNFPTKPGIKVLVTNQYMDKKELILWCANNTVNAFFYNRHSVGLSATTDQAITSGRPLSISTGFTFRHIHKYIKPYPFIGLKETIKNGDEIIKKIQNEWSQENFVKKFENILKSANIGCQEIYVNKEITKLKINKLNIIKELTNKAPTRLKLFIAQTSLAIKRINKSIKFIISGNEKIFLKEECFIHPTLESFANNQEDIFESFMFEKDGVFLDIFPDGPILNNNTYKLYNTGWKGFNIINTSNATLNSFIKTRPRDHNFLVSPENNIKEIFKKICAQEKSLKTFPINLLILNKEILSEIIKEDFLLKNRPDIINIAYEGQFEKIRFFLENEDYMNILKNKERAFFINKFTTNKNILNKLNW